MSDIFQDRERAFEAKFAQDDRQAFERRVHRDRLFGLWAAGKLSLTSTAAATYAEEVVGTNLQHGDDQSMLEKVKADLTAAGYNLGLRQLKKELANADRLAANGLVA